ncbi:MAG: hypothetical protein ACJ8G3_13665 [Burkholderiaceae bacterium]
MGTVISIDFKRRCRTHASPDHEAMPGMQGEAMGIVVCVAALACLAWLQAPLLMPWRPWLPLMHPQAPQLGIGVEEM